MDHPFCLVQTLSYGTDQDTQDTAKWCYPDTRLKWPGWPTVQGYLQSFAILVKWVIFICKYLSTTDI